MAPFSCHNRVSYSPDLAAYLSCLSPFGPSPPSPLPVLLQQAGDEAITPSCYNNHYSEAASDIFPVEIISTLNAGADSVSASTTIPTPEGSSCSLGSGRSTGSSGENKITSASSSSVDPRSQAALILSKTQQYYSTQKRKDRQTSSLSGSANSAKDVKSRKTKKRGGAPEEAPEELKAPSESPVAGYIHVRARPGEATDSHSLAERVRREKIREKMKTLQDLVPGCDKMVGKAQLLEEIIHYVQSLQNQVQFLSMKLASTDPFFHDVDGLGFLDYLILQEEVENISLGLPVVLGTGQTRPMASADAANEDPVHDASVLASLLHEEGPPAAATFPRSPMEAAPCGNVAWPNA